ncbi:uncharacterized protein MYCGRDRAFT_78544, partial [Zymoseptoria tritici IPO323]
IPSPPTRRPLANASNPTQAPSAPKPTSNWVPNPSKKLTRPTTSSPTSGPSNAFSRTANPYPPTSAWRKNARCRLPNKN